MAAMWLRRFGGVMWWETHGADAKRGCARRLDETSRRCTQHKCLAWLGGEVAVAWHGEDMCT